MVKPVRTESLPSPLPKVTTDALLTSAGWLPSIIVVSTTLESFGSMDCTVTAFPRKSMFSW